jgi:Heterokaryon incompatibility protein (HET)
MTAESPLTLGSEWSGKEYEYDLSSQPQKIRIRLLQILDTPPEAVQLKCSLGTFSIDEAPSYVALSYTWGPAEDGPDSDTPEQVHRIALDGGYVDISENLFDALRELKRRSERLTDSDVQRKPYWWIDAICINQKNIGERNQQVNMMDQIYFQASNVTLWLGRDRQDKSSLISDMLSKFNEINEHIQKVAVARQIPRGVLIRQYYLDYLSTFGMPSIGDERWVDFLAFFRKRWFSRLWVVQEVALAQEIEVLCGRTTIQWAHISVCADILNSGLEKSILRGIAARDNTSVIFYSRRAGNIASIRKWCLDEVLPETSMDMYCHFAGRQEYDRKHAATVLLGKVYTCLATDPRDKIFAILGMLKRITASRSALVAADYGKNKVQIYTDTTRAILSATNWLGFLSIVYHPKSARDPELPSWVPNFEEEPISTLSIEGSPAFSTFGKPVATVRESAPSLSFTNNLLCLTGCKVAIIRSKSEPLKDVYNHIADFEDGIKLVLDSENPYPFTGQSRIEAFWRTMIVDQLRNNSSEEWYSSFRSWWLSNMIFRAVLAHNKGVPVHSYIQTIPNVELLARSDDSSKIAGHEMILKTFAEMAKDRAVADDIMTAGTQFGMAVGDWVRSRRLFRTAEGHFGLGYQSMDEDDEVWILSEASVPFVLRKSLNRNINRYSLIGECYVHGMMNGEYLRDSQPAWQNLELE